MIDLNMLSKLTDNHLIHHFSASVQKEREMISDVIAHIAEIDKRSLYAKEGYSSLFNYLREKFHYSESSAYRRIQGAKIMFLFPEILGLLEEGRVTLSTLNLIEPHLTKENVKGIVDQVIGKSKREVESLLDSQFSTKRETGRDKIRKLPVFAPAQADQQHDRSLEELQSQHKQPQYPPVRFSPLSCEPETAQNHTASSGSGSEAVIKRRIKIEFCADEALADKIERAKEILRHKFPKGKFEEIFNQALDDLLEKRDPERKIAKREKRMSLGKQGKDNALPPTLETNGVHLTRYIPEKLRLEIWKRDRGECGYVTAEGKKCNSRSALEIDHIHPWALGGRSEIENLRLLCDTHNRYQAQKTFG